MTVTSRLVVFTFIAAVVVSLAAGLPADTFFAGDSGVKLIVARNAIEHPRSPLRIPLPSVGGERLDLMDPFFYRRDDHATASTSEAFPLAAAPFLAAFGTRGLLVLPMVSLLILLLALLRLRAILGVGSDGTVLAAAVLCTPFVFYALEFWEHLPATSLAAVATTMWLDDGLTPARALVAGVVLGVASLFRPEAILYGVALVTASIVIGRRYTTATIAASAAGVSAALAPLIAFNITDSGSALGTHVAVNIEPQDVTWAALRAHVVRAWFIPPGSGRVLGLAALGILVALVLRWRAPRSSTTIVASMAAAMAVLAADRWFPRESIVAAAPGTLLLFDAPIAVSANRRLLLATAIFFGTLVVLLTSSDGGAQWSPRYLLFAFIPLTPLVGDAIYRAFSVRAVPAAMAIGVLLAASAIVQRASYRELRTTKRIYENVLHATVAASHGGGYVLSKTWWFDEEVAATYPSLTVLYAPIQSDIERACTAFDRAAIDRFVFVNDAGTAAPDASPCAGFHIANRQHLTIPRLAIASLERTYVDRKYQ